MRAQVPPLRPDNIAERAEWARQVTTTPWVPHQVAQEVRADGTLILRSARAMPPVVRNTGVWLHHWAAVTPQSIALRERAARDRSAGDWRELDYAGLLAQVRAVAAALIARGLGAGDSLAILSGNGIDHLILSLAGQYAGIPVVPLAEQYALIPAAHPRLTAILNRVRPRLIFVDDAARYAAALALPEVQGIEVTATWVHPGVTPFTDLLATVPGADLDARHADVGPETLAKILFTSGSSSEPKGVLTTQAMMCANLAQLADVMPFLTAQPPRLTDWLPWNHVFGGSHNVHLALAHGGTLTIDHGKPTAAGLDLTLANRREMPGTLAFNVPVGFALLTEAAATDAGLRARLFSGLDLLFYAGASLPQEVWLRLEQFALAERGGLPLMASSWGLTETAPACLMVHEPIGRSGVVGVPLAGVEVKLIPDGAGRYEARVRGPNVTAGYFADPDKTATAFDPEGFFITGDAMRFVDPADPSRGLIFDGRVSEDFKLDTGTWVQAGPLRLAALAQLQGLAQDVVICGHDRGEVGLFVFPVPALLPGRDQSAGALSDGDLAARIADGLRALNANASGSAKRITRALLLAEPPSLAAHEITDKGSLNIRAVLTRRAALLKRLYDNDDPALIRV